MLQKQPQIQFIMYDLDFPQRKKRPKENKINNEKRNKFDKHSWINPKSK